MVTIDFKGFIRHHYWLGWYYWNDCKKHKHYNSGCEKCSTGDWRHIDNHSNGVAMPSKDKFIIFRMPMNNVVWHTEE